MRNGLRLGTVLPEESLSSIITAEHRTFHKKQKRQRGYSYPEGFHGFLRRRVTQGHIVLESLGVEKGCRAESVPRTV